MVQFLSIFFFLGFLQFLLGFSKVPVFLCHPVPLLLRAILYLSYTISRETGGYVDEEWSNNVTPQRPP